MNKFTEIKKARFIITYVPVSYTHLDVYKRQGESSGGWSDK